MGGGGRQERPGPLGTWSNATNRTPESWSHALFTWTEQLSCGGRAGKRPICKAAGAAPSAHPVALALDLGPGDVRGAAAGSAPANASIVGFLELFHFFPLQPELVAAAHIIPVGQGM